MLNRPRARQTIPQEEEIAQGSSRRGTSRSIRPHMEKADRENFLEAIKKIHRKLKPMYNNWSKNGEIFRTLESVTEEAKGALERIKDTLRALALDSFINEKLKDLDNLIYNCQIIIEIGEPQEPRKRRVKLAQTNSTQKGILHPCGNN